MPTWDFESAENQEYKDFLYAFRLQSRFVVSKLNKKVVSWEDYNDLRCRYGGYPSCNTMKKICVSARGVYSFLDTSYGINWVGLHGMDDSTCIVARHSDVDLKGVGPCFRKVTDDSILRYIAASLQTELEGISKANSSADKLHGVPGLAMKKPFGVVSVNPSTDMVCEHCGYYEAKGAAAKCDAIHFLRKTMLTNPATTMHDTIQTAICAFQLLCCEDLKAQDICVSVCPKISMGRTTTTLSPDEVKEHLALIKRRSMKSKLKLLTIKSSMLDLRHVEQLAQEFHVC